MNKGSLVNNNMIPIKDLITVAAQEAGEFCKTRGGGATKTSMPGIIRDKKEAFMKAACDWCEFNASCTHDVTGDAQIKFWVVVVSPLPFLKTANGTMSDAEEVPPVRMVSVDYDSFCSFGKEIGDEMADPKVLDMVKRECSFCSQSNIVRIYVVFDKNRSAMTMTTIFRCNCKPFFPLPGTRFTEDDFERSLRRALPNDPIEKRRNSAKWLFAMQHREDALLSEKERNMLARGLKHCEVYVRMCRTCNKLGILLQKCGGCKCAWYCDDKCQMKDWKQGGHPAWCARRRELTRLDNQKKKALKQEEQHQQNGQENKSKKK